MAKIFVVIEENPSQDVKVELFEDSGKALKFAHKEAESLCDKDEIEILDARDYLLLLICGEEYGQVSVVEREVK